ncbi:hypothetical protein AB0D62_38555 [Streptomyces massasporeus]|uniref:hypothetical protein n=1 Tax=Streptomyces massasporeus TaxID=67324 RepID=UPI0033FA14F4
MGDRPWHVELAGGLSGAVVIPLSPDMTAVADLQTGKLSPGSCLPDTEVEVWVVRIGGDPVAADGYEDGDCKSFGVTPDHGRCIDDQ